MRYYGVDEYAEEQKAQREEVATAETSAWYTGMILGLLIGFASALVAASEADREFALTIRDLLIAYHHSGLREKAGFIAVLTGVILAQSQDRLMEIALGVQPIADAAVAQIEERQQEGAK